MGHNYGIMVLYIQKRFMLRGDVTRLIWKLQFRTHCNLLHTINNCYPIKLILEKRCIKFLHSCLSSDNLVISNFAKSFVILLLIKIKIKILYFRSI